MSSLEGVFPVELQWVKAVFLKCGGKLVLVDTGMKPEDAETLLSYAQNKLKMPPKLSLELCVLTHRHQDHAGGLKKLAEVCAFKVAAHENDADAIEASTGVKVSLRLKDVDVLPHCGGIQVVHIPGHTDGNICFYMKKGALLLAGDTVHLEEGRLSPPWDRYCKDPAMTKRELKRLRGLDFDRIICSHGDDVEKGGKEKLEELLQTLKLI